MEVRQIEYGRVLLWAKLLVLEGRKRSTSIGLFFFFPLFFGTDYFERRWLSISQHFVRHLSAEIYGMKDKRCVLFCFFHPFVFFTIRFRSVTNETDLRSTCRCSKSFFFLSLARFHPYFFSFILWRARRISDDTPGSSPNCHHPIAACNDTHPQREVSFSFSDWGGALVQSGPTVGLYSFWFFKVLLPSWPGAINHGPRLLPPLSASLK